MKRIGQVPSCASALRVLHSAPMALVCMGAAGGVALWLPTPALGVEPPTGIYVLGEPANVNNLLGNYTQALTAETDSGLDLFTGYMLRVHIADLIVNDNATSGAIQWDFAPIINSFTAIQQETGGIRPASTRDPVTLKIMHVILPAIVMAQIPTNQTFVDLLGTTRPLPWSAAGVNVLVDMYTALANTPITDFSQTGNPTVLLKDHPTLKTVVAANLNHSGYRDLRQNTGHVWEIVGYDRDLYVAGLVASVAANTDALPNAFSYMQYFGFNDGLNNQFGGETLDQWVDSALSAVYNGPGQPGLGVFRENVGDLGPTAAGAQNMLDFEEPGFLDDAEGRVLFQALTAWIAPFGEPAVNRDQQTDSGSPAYGILRDYTAFGSRYFEAYAVDLALSTTHIKTRFEDILGHVISDTEAADIKLTLSDLLADWNAYLQRGPTLVADSATVNQDSGANTISVMANDAPLPTGSPWANPLDTAPPPALVLTVQSVTQGAHGSVAIAANGTDVTYTPDAGFSGADSFTYTVSDGYGGTAATTVSIMVTSNSPQVPAVSEWGVAILSLLVLSCGTVLLQNRVFAGRFTKTWG